MNAAEAIFGLVVAHANREIGILEEPSRSALLAERIFRLQSQIFQGPQFGKDHHMLPALDGGLRMKQAERIS